MKREGYFKKLPFSIWILGLVSLLTDISSEIIRSFLPVFIVSILGSTVTYLGIIEGIAELSISFAKIFSGLLSDVMKARKSLTILGYSLSAFSKPLFPLAHSIGTVFTARLLDRLGKGMREAPRDALIGDIAPKESRGAFFGLRQSLDSLGAFIGPLLAILLMILTSNNIRFVYWIATIPALIAVLLLILFIKEPAKETSAEEQEKIDLTDVKLIRKDYWRILLVSATLGLAQFSESFLILKAHSAGLRANFLPLVVATMSATYALASYPAGVFSDYMNRKTIILLGIGFLIAADIILGLSSNLWIIFLGFSLWGVYLGLTQGLFGAIITETTSHRVRGTAFGIYYLACGTCALISNMIVGLLWQHYNAHIPFFYSAFVGGVAFILLLCFNHQKD